MPIARRLRSNPPARTIVLAKAAGFCFGVRRAVEMAERARHSTDLPVVTLGPLVHNDQVTRELNRERIGMAKSVEDVQEGILVISAHGTSTQMRERASARGLELLDATCPFVTRVHRAARELVGQRHQILLVGDKGHTEVLGVVGAIEALGGNVQVVSTAAEVDAIELGRKVGVISQTTQYSSTFAEVVAAVCRRVQDVRAVNTVCGATEELQAAAVEMAGRVDVAIVIGGRSSANSRRLREICAAEGIPAYQVETAEDIEEAWLAGKERIGLTAGASTPDSEIERAARRLNGGELPDDWNLMHPD